MEPSNCYQVFDCDENVSKDHIKAQYKKIALQVSFLPWIIEVLN